MYVVRYDPATLQVLEAFPMTQPQYYELRDTFDGYVVFIDRPSFYTDDVLRAFQHNPTAFGVVLGNPPRVRRTR